MLTKNLQQILNFQITNLYIRNIESNNIDVISKEITKSVQNIIFLFFVNNFTPEQFQSLKVKLTEILNDSKNVRLCFQYKEIFLIFKFYILFKCKKDVF